MQIMELTAVAKAARVIMDTMDILDSQEVLAEINRLPLMVDLLHPVMATTHRVVAQHRQAMETTHQMVAQLRQSATGNLCSATQLYLTASAQTLTNKPSK